MIHKELSTYDTTQAVCPFIVALEFFLQSHSPGIMHNNDLVGSVRKRKKSIDVEGGDDRLSSLTDDLIHEIFSFMSIKDAIRTCVLSSRWKFIWTSMPDLNFENLNDRPHLSKFISNVLSNRNKKIQVSSVSLLLGRTVTDDESVSRILSFAFSHNLQQLSVIRAPGNSIIFPYSFIVTPKWDLPALTTLHLHCVKLMSDDLFSKCTNLKNLILKECTLMEEMEVLTICHPRLSDLTLVSTPPDMELQEGVNVVAPQLKNLTIKWCEGTHLISAPGLTSLVIEGFHPCQIFTCTKPGFHSLEKVRLYFYDAGNADAHKIVSLLQQLHSVKLLTLNLQILQRLFSIKVRPRFRNVKRRMSKSARFSLGMEVSPYKTCVLANAKIVKFVPSIPESVYLEKVTTCTEIKNYDDNSPSSIFPMVSREEIIVMGDIALAHEFVRHLRTLVKECKANSDSETDKAHMDEHGKPQVWMMLWAWELQYKLRKMMAMLQQRVIVELENCRMMASLRRRYNIMERGLETHPIVTWLEDMRALFERIQRLISQLSASKRDVLRPIFLSLCQDAVILTNNMLGLGMDIEDYKLNLTDDEIISYG
ncbi:unnamed protein product [Lactuca virosa]|uniref:F-box domain-containing protein n=1 Tax=Lactuca virosa TaxID=75947 RepID=A0AAU9LK91_9ASTR|nr:unnamed protein product [Lactuca virosa]